jgi:uncharacterized membrane protein (UPF0127 family)
VAEADSLARRLVLAGALSLLVVCAALAQTGRPQSGLKVESLIVDTARGPVKLQVEIADTARKREIGMMYRRWIAPDRGMLFDFPRPEPAAFWMKNTFIPLDIVFIGANGRVLNIAHGKPLDETPLQSHGAARGVLEIAGGRAGELRIAPGDRVRHRIFPK